MSYWVSLEDEDGKCFESQEKITAGGTYQVGGTNETSLNVTYNYGKLYAKHLAPDSLRWLHGKTASETKHCLASAVDVLGTEQSHNYWESTPGNAGYALSILLRWATEFPHGTWDVE